MVVVNHYHRTITKVGRFLPRLQRWFFVSQEITSLEEAVGHLETVVLGVFVHLVVSVGLYQEMASCRGKEGGNFRRPGVFVDVKEKML